MTLPRLLLIFSIISHLAAGELGLDAGQAVVHPVFGERLAGGAFALGEFVFVMREQQVHPAAVDVEGFAEVFHAHGRALDVPAGPALAPGRIPHRLAGLGGFPEGEVGGVALAGAFQRRACRLPALRPAVGQLAVVGVLGDIEPDVALGRVGEALVDQLSGTSR